MQVYKDHGRDQRQAQTRQRTSLIARGPKVAQAAGQSSLLQSPSTGLDHTSRT
jgi:hypothetical protein